MAHEMIHVYCFLHGITDHDRTDYHNKSFLEVAEKHGMYCREYHTDIGYSDVWLTDEQIDRVIVRIPDEIWDAMTSNIKFVNVRKSIQKFLCIEYDDEFASEAYDWFILYKRAEEH